MADKKQQVKCPICGRFTTEKALEAYTAEYENRINALSSALKLSQDKVENLRVWLNEKNEKLEEANKKNVFLDSQIGNLKFEMETLRNRSWWERLLDL